jgi:hypothetical protein
MLSSEDRAEVRAEVRHELAEIENSMVRNAGSYNYLCAAGGLTFFAHQPVGVVLRSIPHV